MRRRANALSRCRGASQKRCRVMPALAALGAVTGLGLGSGTSALAQVAVPPSNGPCVVVGTTATCTGNVAAGVDASSPLDTLNVNNLLAPGIAPASGTEGINFNVAGPQNITINADTSGTAGVATTGDNAEGIYGALQSGDGNIVINSTGNVSTQGDRADGLYARQNGGDGNITIISTGNVTTAGGNAQAIHAEHDATSSATGNVTIHSTGNITTTGSGAGIQAHQFSGTGDINVTSIGTINTAGIGIEGDNDGAAGNINITSTGNITTAGNDAEAIHADKSSRDDGSISIVSTGNLQTTGDNSEGIHARQERTTGDISIISNGEISTQGSGAEGIFAQNNNTGNGNIAVVSNGKVMTSGAGAHGISARGFGTTTVTSSSDITTTGTGDPDGINVRDGGIAHIFSSGTINAADDGVYVYHSSTSQLITVTNTGDVTAGRRGLYAGNERGGDISIVNSGNINSADIGIEGELNDAGTLNISNSANVTTTGTTGEGIHAYSFFNGNLNVNNTGNISTVGTSAEGIFARADQGNSTVNISTSGTVTATNAAGVRVNMDAAGTVGINTSGGVTGTTGILIDVRDMNAPVTINAAGAITGTGGTAIDFQGDGNDVLNILPGSAINGSIDFGNGNGTGPGGTPGNANDIDTLNFAPGVNALVNFADSGAGGTAQPDGDDLQSAPENINGNVVLLNGGLTAVAVDTTGFSSAQTWLNSLTESILGALEGLFTPAVQSEPEQTVGFTLPGGTNISPVSSVDHTGKGHRIWGTAFGSVRDQDAGQGNAGLDQVSGGLMFGAEGIKGDGFRAGAFGGGSWSDIGVQTGTQNIEVSSGLGGVYARKDWENHWIKAVITGGYAHHDSQRQVAAAAMQTARAKYDGYFIAPGISAGTRLAQPSENHSLWGSIRVHYGSMFLDGYRETGSAAPLTVASRDVHILNTRAQLSSPYTQRGHDGALFQFEGRLGVDAQFNLGNNQVNTTVAGTPFSFRASFNDELISGFAGATLKRTSSDGRLYFAANLEGHLISDGSYEVRGQANGGWRF